MSARPGGGGGGSAHCCAKKKQYAFTKEFGNVFQLIFAPLESTVNFFSLEVMRSNLSYVDDSYVADILQGCDNCYSLNNSARKNSKNSASSSVFSSFSAKSNSKMYRAKSNSKMYRAN